jgi:hypothetical protein
MVDWHQSNRGVSLCISIYLLLFVIVVVLSVSVAFASLLLSSEDCNCSSHD